MRTILLLASLLTVISGCQEPDRIPLETVRKITLGMKDEDVSKLIEFRPCRVNRPITAVAEFVLQSGSLTLSPKGFPLKSEKTESKWVADGVVEFFDMESGAKVGWSKAWETNRQRLAVLFNEEGRVVGKVLYRY